MVVLRDGGLTTVLGIIVDVLVIVWLERENSKILPQLERGTKHSL